MNTLYPLKFKPILKNKIWGGERLYTLLNKQTDGNTDIGESWELSGVKGDVSVVADGFLAENTIEELIEVYMGDLVGDKVFEQFGTNFPLLIKFIDANRDMSVQVHPNDELAHKRHNSFGKTEMWYIVDNKPNAELILGLNNGVTKQQYLQKLHNNSIKDILHTETVKKGNAFFIPSGTVHAICSGILLAEIQQTSDITYRIYDWDRVQSNGKPRELHTEQAIDAIDFDSKQNCKISYENTENKSNKIVNCPYFSCNKLNINKKIEKDFIQLDSFVIYMGIEGTSLLFYNPDLEPITIKKGETVLVPAMLKHLYLEPCSETSELLEIYIKNENI